MTASLWECVVLCSVMLTACLPLIATTFQGPLPRPKRKLRRPAEDKGLPGDDELRSLANIFLVKSREVWPELAAAGIFPKPTEAVLNQYVENFKRRHRGSQPAEIDMTIFNKYGLALSADYPRFSDDNSQTKSISDQMCLAIGHGKAIGCVVVWELLFADYACSASYGRRQGFESLLKLIASKRPGMKAVLIDDFARASRNDYEAWKLAGTCKNLNINLIGVSDGFHLNDPDWDVKVSLFNLFHRLEAKYRNQRVLRGMKSSSRGNTSLGRLPFGFTRAPMLGSDGRALTKPNGVPRHKRCIDPVTSPSVVKMFELYIEKRWSPYKIAQEFNRHKVDGWNRWNESVIRKMLINPAYIGLVLWNTTSRVYDWVKEDYVRNPNPWQKWGWYYDPELALIPKAWHVEARARLQKSRRPRGKNGATKAERVAVTLFSGTLFCKYCGREVNLMRSDAGYKQMGCPNGFNRWSDCQLRCSKSARVIELTLLSIIRRDLLTEERLTELVRRANKHVETLRNKPKQDLRPLQQRCKELRGKIDQLLERLEGTQRRTVVEEYEARIDKLTAVHRDALTALAAASKANLLPSDDLKAERVKVYVDDLRGLLNQEIPAAAEALRALTGPIMVSQQPSKTRRHGATWIATFTPNLMGFLHYAAVELGYPESTTTALLTDLNWTTSEELAVPIDAKGVLLNRLDADLLAQLVKIFSETPEVTDWQIRKRLGCGFRTAQRYRNLWERGEI